MNGGQPCSYRCRSKLVKHGWMPANHAATAASQSRSNIDQRQSSMQLLLPVKVGQCSITLLPACILHCSYRLLTHHPPTTWHAHCPPQTKTPTYTADDPVHVRAHKADTNPPKQSSAISKRVRTYRSCSAPSSTSWAASGWRRGRSSPTSLLSCSSSSRRR